jgi:hypothetical protein
MAIHASPTRHGIEPFDEIATIVLSSSQMKAPRTIETNASAAAEGSSAQVTELPTTKTLSGP